VAGTEARPTELFSDKGETSGKVSSTYHSEGEPRPKHLIRDETTACRRALTAPSNGRALPVNFDD
jgi:hypothetical protein